jgi:glycosyltransferase involved in cell wall biosynthesis
VPPLRVVQVSGYLDPARRTGPELVRAWPSLLDAARSARAAGFEVSVVQAAARDEHLRDGDIDVHFVTEPAWPQRLRRALEPGLRVVPRVRGLAPDLIHLHGLGFPLLARRLARVAPLLVQDHSDRPLRALLPLQRWGLAAADGFAFTAAELAGPLRRAGVIRPHQPVFEVLEVTTGFTPGAATGAGIHGDPCILWIGRLIEGKDPFTFLEGLAGAFGRLPGARAWMAYGDSALEAEVRRRIAADPVLADRVVLLGRVSSDRVQALCRAADLFVSTSRFEGSSYAMLEAAACGATPVLTDIPAFRRMSRDGAIGALFPPGDAAALSDALVGAAAEAGDRTRVLAFFREHLSREAVARELEAAYLAVRGLR